MSTTRTPPTAESRLGEVRKGGLDWPVGSGADGEQLQAREALAVVARAVRAAVHDLVVAGREARGVVVAEPGGDLRVVSADRDARGHRDLGGAGVGGAVLVRLGLGGRGGLGGGLLGLVLLRALGLGARGGGRGGELHAGLADGGDLRGGRRVAPVQALRGLAVGDLAEVVAQVRAVGRVQGVDAPEAPELATELVGRRVRLVHREAAHPEGAELDDVARHLVAGGRGRGVEGDGVVVAVGQHLAAVAVPDGQGVGVEPAAGAGVAGPGVAAEQEEGEEDLEAVLVQEVGHGHSSPEPPGKRCDPCWGQCR